MQPREDVTRRLELPEIELIEPPEPCEPVLSKAPARKGSQDTSGAAKRAQSEGFWAGFWELVFGFFLFGGDGGPETKGEEWERWVLKEDADYQRIRFRRNTVNFPEQSGLGNIA